MLTPKEKYLNQRIDKDASFEDLLKFPKYIEIGTVNACNARCSMCTIDSWELKTPTMKDDLFEKLADEIAEHRDSVKRVSLYRDGEPLLDKKLPKRIAYLKEKGVKYVGIATNGSLLDEKRSRAILEAGIDEIILSVDSLKKDVYEEIRIGLNFETVLQNAIRFVELRDEIRPRATIWMRMIVGDNNADEWPEYEAFWKPKLAEHDRLYHHSMHNWGGQIEVKEKASTYEPSHPCVALWSLMPIFGNGDIPLCNVDYNNKYPTGNVATHSIAEVWQSKVLNERRQLHLNDQKNAIPLCENCNVWDEQTDSEAETGAEYFSKISEV